MKTRCGLCSKKCTDKIQLTWANINYMGQQEVTEETKSFCSNKCKIRFIRTEQEEFLQDRKDFYLDLVKETKKCFLNFLMFGLKRDDVDLVKCTAILKETKNGSTRRIGLSPRAVKELRNLTPTIDGRFFPTHADQFKHFWTQLNKRCGLKKNFHLLRHEFASRSFEKGWDISAVATQGGWRDWKVLRRYTALSPEYLAEKFKQSN